MGFGLPSQFIDHLYKRFVSTSTSNYTATSNLHNSQNTKEQLSPLPAFPSQQFRRVKILQLHALKSSVLKLPCRTGNWLGSPSCLQDNSLARTSQKHRLFNSTSIIVRRFVVLGTCLPSCYLESVLAYLPIMRLFHGNGLTHYIATSEWLTGLPPLLLFRGLCLRRLSLDSHLLLRGLVFPLCLDPNCSRCSLLKAAHPECLKSYRHFFFSEGYACDVCA
jgi:hypothetical protein